MSRKFCAVLAATMCLFLATAAFAGAHPHERDGFVIGFNLGLGSATVHPDQGSDESETGGGGAFRLGWAFQNQYMVGLDSGVWMKNEDGGDVTLSSYLACFTFYPSGGGFFVRGGAGAGKVEVTIDVGGPDLTVSESGGAFGLGAGHEWRLGQKFALGAAADYHRFSIDGGDFSFLNFTAQFNWYF